MMKMMNKPAATGFLQHYNTDHDFIHHLRMKLINGEEGEKESTLTTSKEKRFYFKETPWEIFKEATDREIYFFTETPGFCVGNRNRLEDTGNWRIATSVAIKDFKSEIIGFKKTRLFTVPETYVSEASMRLLIIHEYSLCGSDDTNSLVLCKIRKPMCATPSLWARVQLQAATPSLWARQELQATPKRHADDDMDIEDQGQNKRSKVHNGGRMSLSRRRYLLKNMASDRETTEALCALEAWKPF